MKKDTQKKALTDWDWTTLVAAWRYYEHGHTITSAMFPHEIVTRFFTGFQFTRPQGARHQRGGAP